MKGEQGKPDIKANKKKQLKKDYSSEKEGKKSKNQRKSSKKTEIKINRSEIVEYPPEQLPEDAEFKGYQEVIVQDILLKTDNVLLRKQKFYSHITGKTYLASLPVGYEGEFGPGIKALVTSLYYSGNMTQGKLQECLEDLGISISAGYLSNLLIKNPGDFETEFNEVYRELLAYREAPSLQAAEQLRAEFYRLFDSDTGYQELDERKRLTSAKISELLLVLDHPELPLHNNPAELGARTMVQRRNISYATQTLEGTKAWDIFMSLVAWLRLANWESVFSNTCVTAFLNWEIFLLWQL